MAQTHAHDPDALAIWVSEFDGHSDAQVDFEYACDVFDADFPMDAAARHIETFLRALVEGGERRLGELDPLSAAEREELIHTRNATDQAFPEQATLPTLFAEQVARTRNAPRCWKPTAARSAMPSWTPRSRPAGRRPVAQRV
ncbi:hypothetical protein P4123_16935 [Pseudomonas aeruginosa]|nr:hypothetical protein [Pseudomonas aeruginosa]